MQKLKKLIISIINTDKGGEQQASKIRPFAAAAELTGYQNVIILDTPATAYAAGGQFDKATIAAEKALSSALAEQDEISAWRIRRQIENYKKQPEQQ